MLYLFLFLSALLNHHYKGSLNFRNEGLHSFQNFTFKVTDKYFLFPIQENSDEFKTRIYVDGENVVSLDVRFAKDKVTYLFPLNTTDWIGKEVTINIDRRDVNISEYIFWNQFKPSDEYGSLFNYDEQYRPWFHFAPEYGWMNDPNGMFATSNQGKTTYHFHYQYNPYAAVWGNMHWGHAISSDLLHWEYLPFSLSPDDLGQIFSGSSVVDHENSAGYGENSIISFYTSAGTHQQQSMAYSTDNGFSFKKYEKNPVIPNTDKVDFRDPKVIKIKKNGEAQIVYVMCLAVGNHIEFYSSKDLINWNYTSSFGEKYGTHGGVWECPDLLYFEEFNKFVLLVNVNPGGPFGGSACQYFVGNFNGEKFECDDSPETIRWLEYGKDAYATVTYPKDANLQQTQQSKIKSPKAKTEYIGMTWMSNWEYANTIPTQYYRSANSIPRKITLVQVKNSQEFRVSNLPFDNIQSIRDTSYNIDPFTLSDEQQKVFNNALKDSKAFEIDIEFTVNNLTTMGIKFTNNKNEEYTIQFNPSSQTVSCNRKKSGIVSFADSFPAITSASIPITKETYKWKIFIDTCSIEFFDEDGLATMTNLVFPTNQYSNIVVFKSNSEGTLDVKTIQIHSLSKVMHSKDDNPNPPNPSNPSKKNLIKILIIAASAVAALAVIAIIILVVVIVKRKKAGENQTKANLLNE
ncbi:hypothetical protein M9Y10_015003 [Tritrichomonas musculus]|uniref:Uncharacterized protein n=1 Tax=Tritrichomonas musculus TaxID=1915356 RepID=A0ABR2L119_9EUKA